MKQNNAPAVVSLIAATAGALFCRARPLHAALSVNIPRTTPQRGRNCTALSPAGSYNTSSLPRLSAVVSPSFLAAAFFAVLFCTACGSRPPAEPRISSPFQAFLRRPDASLIAYTATSENTEQELALLRKKFNGLILYGFDAHTAAMLSTAAQLKYQAVLATIWDPRSEEEIGLAAKVLSQYADRFAIAVSIGSEGLLENRYSLSDVESAAGKLDRLSGHNFEKTTSEPWWRYLDGQPSASELRAFGDFIAVHVHVVWDADIRDPAEAARWSRDRAAQIAALSGKTVLVREAGFPGSGRSPRASAQGLVFSRQAQAEFWKQWVSLRAAQPRGVSLAGVFEGIDNPRKTWRDFESSWGLLSAGELEPHPAFDVFPDVP